MIKHHIKGRKLYRCTITLFNIYNKGYDESRKMKFLSVQKRIEFFNSVHHLSCILDSRILKKYNIPCVRYV